jgi:hypothetical protein
MLSFQAVHGKPGLVASGGALGRLLPLLYAQTVIRADMIRTVDLGPFKHKVGWVCSWENVFGGRRR